MGTGIRTSFPDHAKFAFSILDDTDDATVENVQPVYDLLTELGLRTTKTVWPLSCPEGSDLYFAGQTLADADYLSFVRSLIAKGFEPAYHGATMESSDRARTEAGLRTFSELLGVQPTLYCNHGQNRENVYWGSARYRTLAIRLPLALAERVLGKPKYAGHVPGSPFFWGDLCQRQFRFVRNFTFSTVNSGNISPGRPYRLKGTPWVRYWFNTADAPDVGAFKRLMTRSRITELYREGGVCILSTHLGKGFARNGRVDPSVEDTLRYMASLPGWFRPVSEILDFLATTSSTETLSTFERWHLEGLHVVDRARARLNARRGTRMTA